MRHTSIVVATLVALAAPGMGAARPAQSSGTFRTLLEEDFSLITEGTEADPGNKSIIEDQAVLGNIPTSMTHTPGWRGAMVYPAGGMVKVGTFSTSVQTLTGMIITPTVPNADPDAFFLVSIDARTIDGSNDYIEIAQEYGDGSGLGLEIIPINGEWNTVTAMFTADVNITPLYFGINASRAEIMADNVKVELFTPYLKAPKTLSALEYTGTSFKARWGDVAEADAYLLSVFSTDAQGNRSYFLDEERVEGTEYTVTDLNPAVTYSYLVKAVNSQYTSPESQIVQVKGVTAPVMNAPENATDAGFHASWEPVPLATNYEIWTYHHHTAREAEDYVLTDEKFSKVRSSGTVKNPEDPTDATDTTLDKVMTQPGWTLQGAAFVDGAVGMNAEHYLYGVSCQLTSPIMNLSNGDGAVDVSFKVWLTDTSAAGHQTIPVVSMIHNAGGGDLATVDQAVLENLTPGRWNTVTCTIKNGTDHAQVMLFPYGNTGYMFVDNLKVTKHLEAGEDILKPVAYHFTTANSIDVECVKPAEDCWAYRGRSWRIEGDYNLSDWSDYAHSERHTSGAESVSSENGTVQLAVGSGMLRVENGSDKAVAVYSLEGAHVASIAAGATSELTLLPGVYIAAGRKLLVK